MLRPRVTHSAAHRNIRQKRPWMEYSGTTSWGVRRRGQRPGARTDPSFKGTHSDLWELKGPQPPIPSQVAEQTKQFPDEEDHSGAELGWEPPAPNPDTDLPQEAADAFDVF